MNWLDLVILVLLAIGAFMGLRTGLIGAAITAAGGIIGWLLAGRFSDKVGGLFGDSLSNDTIVTVISYIIIIAVALFVARFIARIIRPILSIATLGLSSMVDRLGGLALGLLLGVAIGSAFIIVMARFAYNFELPDIPDIPNVPGVTGEGIIETATSRIPDVQNTKESVEGALATSTIVPIFVNITNALPADALGFVPDDFRVALEILDQRIEEGEDSPS